ncbi:MAG: hypothetical protein L3J35_12270 [Bacteroidales bacterium]|nr:hypothetical protein [Bacteroidales bacterium]
MKKINVLLIALFVGALSFTSCDNEIDPSTIAAPVITFTEGNASILTGEAVSVSGTIFAEGELDLVVIKKNVGGTITELDNVSKFDIKTSHDFLFDFTDVQESFTVTVEATDKEGVTKSATATITATVPETIVKSTSAVRVYSAPATTSSTEQFASLTSFTAYTWTDAGTNVATVDLNYYNGNFTKGVSYPHFISPSITPTTYTINNGNTLTSAKTTWFKVLDATDLTNVGAWADINDDSAISAITGITSTNITWTDAAETILAFELADGKKGLIRVGAAVDGNINGTFYDANADYIEFDVIVQKNAPVVK